MRWPIVAAAASLLTLSASAYAEGASISVTIHGCAYDSAELERLVRLELASVLEESAEPSAYGVTVTCAKGSVRVALLGPLTNKSLERNVVAPAADEPEPERLLAITIAQLYRASWRELSLEAEPPAKRALPPASSPRRSATEVSSARRFASPARPAPVEEPPRASVGVAGGMRVRRLQAATVLPHLEAAFTYAPLERLFWVSLSSGFERARLDRRSGVIDVTVGSVIAGVGVEPLVVGVWSGFAEAGVGLAVVDLSAVEVEPGYFADSITGVGFEATGGFGAAVTLEPFRLELAARGGVLYGTPDASIADDEDLRLDGLWAGTDLRVRWMF